MARRAVPSSAASIRSLRAQGWTDARIGRALGRDSSLIGQIAKGSKPGRNLAGPLSALSEGRSRVPAPERRKTKTGAAAKTRQSPLDSPEYRGVETARDFEKLLRRYADKGFNVVVRTTWQNLDRRFNSPSLSTSDPAGVRVTALQGKSGSNWSTQFGRDNGTGKGRAASAVLGDFERFAGSKAAQGLDGRELLEAFATARANVTTAAKPGAYQQEASGFISIEVQPVQGKRK